MSDIATWELRQLYPWAWAPLGLSRFVRRPPLVESRSFPPSWHEAFGPLLVVGVVRREARTTHTGRGPNDSSQGEGAGPRWSPLLYVIIGACWVPSGVKQWAQKVYSLSSSAGEVNTYHYGFYAAIREYLW
eukprot:8918554-Pyramimonas_sp.AAC.1